MELYKEFFSGKSITLMRIGLLGRGVGDAAFLAECGADVLVVDSASQDVMQPSVDKLAHYPNIRFKFGPYDPEDFMHCDMVLKGAGAPLNSPEIAAAKKAGVPVYMSTALFAKFAREAGATIVGVTGTRGKSTVTHLIYHALKFAAPRSDSGRERKIFLGGNVRGLSTLAMLPDVQAGDIVVLELDSWQLQGFGDLKISPQVAVFTNLMEDHVNYYPSESLYFADKANIFKYQQPGDTLIAGPDIAPRIHEANPNGNLIIPAPIPESWQLGLVGAHNRENAALAAEALRALGLASEEIKSGIETFSGVEGRLQKVATLHGVEIYNDNNSTTPDATIAALKALDPHQKQRVVLIMGGSDKGLDLSAMRAAVHAHCKKVFLLAGTGTDKVRSHTPDTPVFDSIKQALDAAVAAAAPGDAILFSPAFASFGMFKNEYDRNDQFLAAVKALA